MSYYSRYKAKDQRVEWSDIEAILRDQEQERLDPAELARLYELFLWPHKDPDRGITPHMGSVKEWRRHDPVAVDRSANAMRMLLEHLYAHAP